MYIYIYTVYGPILIQEPLVYMVLHLYQLNVNVERSSNMQMERTANVISLEWPNDNAPMHYIKIIEYALKF